MAEFDWNQYKPERDSFDWEKFAADSQGGVSPSSADQVDAVTRGAAQGATLGFRDELAGLLASPTGAGKAILEKIGGDYSGDTDVAKYKAERDESRALDEAAEKAHPGTYTASMIGGGIALPALAAGALPAGAVAAGGGLAGALGLGAAAGAGASKEESGLGLLKDTGIGGATGGLSYGLGKAVQAGTQGIGNLMGAGAEKAQSLARSGAEGLAKLAAGAPKSADDDIGRYLLDKGLVKGFDTSEDIANRVAPALKSARFEQKVLGSSEALDKLGPLANAAKSKSDFNPWDILSGISGPVKSAVGSRALSTGAVALDKGSKTLLDPESIREIAPRLGKYGKVLIDAANRSGAAFNATHFLLDRTDPEYREAMRQARGDSN